MLQFMNTEQAKKATEPTIHQIRQRSGYVTRCTRSSILLNTTATSKMIQEQLNSVGELALDLVVRLLFSNAFGEL